MSHLRNSEQLMLFSGLLLAGWAIKALSVVVRAQ
jgi:hypothetical protein